jgi:integrase
MRRTRQVVTAIFFHENGRPIRSFRNALDKGCTAAGLPGQLFHGFRRTAARNLMRAGVAEPVAMRLTGHLTPSIFRRYAIVDEVMLAEGVAKLDEYTGGQAAAARAAARVIGIR